MFQLKAQSADICIRFVGIPIVEHLTRRGIQRHIFNLLTYSLGLSIQINMGVGFILFEGDKIRSLTLYIQCVVDHHQFFTGFSDQSFYYEALAGHSVVITVNINHCQGYIVDKLLENTSGQGLVGVFGTLEYNDISPFWFGKNREPPFCQGNGRSGLELRYQGTGFDQIGRYHGFGGNNIELKYKMLQNYYNNNGLQNRIDIFPYRGFKGTLYTLLLLLSAKFLLLSFRDIYSPGFLKGRKPETQVKEGRQQGGNKGCNPQPGVYGIIYQSGHFPGHPRQVVKNIDKYNKISGVGLCFLVPAGIFLEKQPVQKKTVQG